MIAYLIDSTFAFTILENQLAAYCNNPSAQANPFDVKTVPVLTRAQELAERKRMFCCFLNNPMPLNILDQYHTHPSLGGRSATAQFAKAAGIAAPSPMPGQVGTATLAAAAGVPTKDLGALLEKIPEFGSFGACLRTSKGVALTETDVAEYVVTCVKHMFDNHVVFQVLWHSSIQQVFTTLVRLQKHIG
jgi:coatomer protein complex subunit gamma